MLPGATTGRRTVLAWALYDFANSAFSAIVVATIFPVYYAEMVVGNREGLRRLLVGTRRLGLDGPGRAALAGAGGHRRPRGRAQALLRGLHPGRGGGDRAAGHGRKPGMVAAGVRAGCRRHGWPSSWRSSTTTRICRASPLPKPSGASPRWASRWATRDRWPPSRSRIRSWPRRPTRACFLASRGPVPPLLAARLRPAPRRQEARSAPVARGGARIQGHAGHPARDRLAAPRCARCAAFSWPTSSTRMR